MMLCSFSINQLISSSLILLQKLYSSKHCCIKLDQSLDDLLSVALLKSHAKIMCLYVLRYYSPEGNTKTNACVCAIFPIELIPLVYRGKCYG